MSNGKISHLMKSGLKTKNLKEGTVCRHCRIQECSRQALQKQGCHLDLHGSSRTNAADPSGTIAYGIPDLADRLTDGFAAPLRLLTRAVERTGSGPG
jgi:hypothetical protein